MTITALAPITPDAAGPDASDVRLYPLPKDTDFIIETPNGEVHVAAFLFAGDLERIGERLIHEHRQFSHLHDATIIYRWKLTGGGSGGNVTLGACQKLSGLVAHETGADFCIWLGVDNVRATMLTVRQVEALMFHALCQAGQKDNGGWCLINHEFTGFVSEVAAYGF